MQLELSEALVARLNERAKSLGVAPEDLARAAVVDLVAQPDDEFEAIASAVLSENAELYKRLA